MFNRFFFRLYISWGNINNIKKLSYSNLNTYLKAKNNFFKYVNKEEENLNK